MASRQSKQTLGTPYQIYSEIANAGKNLASTKRRISWRFGWSEGEGNHEILLVHSIVSGKKVIFEDGREIVTSSSIMSKDFTHGWNSSNYIFRVEVDGRMEHDYVFSIDGVPFAQMQRKRDLDNNYNHSNDNKSERASISNSTPPKKSNTPFSKNAPGSATKADDSRSTVQSPKTTKIDSFDPFGTENGSSDPFGENSQIAPPESEVSLMDSWEDNSAAPQLIQSNIFDPFGSAPDPFAPNPVKKSAQDISNDFAGLSFAATPPSSPVFSQETQQTADNLFDHEEHIPVPPVIKTPTKEVWSAPKNLVNLDFNAPLLVSSSNAFSGRSPSLNLLLIGSQTRIQGANGLNTPAPPKAPMNNGMGTGQNQGQGQGMNGNQGPMNGNQGQGPMQGGMRGGPGIQNNNPMGGSPNQMGFNGNNGMGMGQNQGGQGMMQLQPPQQQQYGMFMNQPMSQGGQMGGVMGQVGGQGMSQQGQGMNQMQGNGMMNQQGQGGMGVMSGGPGMMNGGMANNRLMMNNSGMSPQGGTGNHLASTSGATSSLAGNSIARGVPVATAGPKSSLDGFNWKI